MHQHAVQTTGIVSLCVKRRSRTGATPITAVVLCLFVFLFIFFLVILVLCWKHGQRYLTDKSMDKLRCGDRSELVATADRFAWPVTLADEHPCYTRTHVYVESAPIAYQERLLVPQGHTCLFIYFFLFEKGEFHIVGYMKIYKSCGGTTVQWISWWWVERRTQSLNQFSNRWWKTFHDSRGYIAWAEQKRKSFITGAIDVYCTRGHVFLEQPARRLGWPQYTKPKLEKGK